MKKALALLLSLMMTILIGCGVAELPDPLPVIPDATETGNLLAPEQTEPPEQSLAPVSPPSDLVPSGTATLPIDEDSVIFLARKGSTLYRAAWDTVTGELFVDEAPLLVSRGARSAWDVNQSICAWDGKDAFVVSNSYATLTAAQDSPAAIELVSAALKYGAGYTLKFSETQCEVTLEDDSYVISIEGMLSPMAEENAVKWLVSSHQEENVLYLFFTEAAIGTHRASIFYAESDLNEGTVKWSEPLNIPEAFYHGLLDYGVPQCTAVVDGKLYLSGQETILCFDYEKNELRDLSDITDWLDALLPDTERAAGFGTPFATVPKGQCGDIVICSMEYRGANDASRHFVAYYAIENESLVGVLVAEDIGGEPYRLATYDKNGKLLFSEEPEYEFVTVPRYCY